MAVIYVDDRPYEVEEGQNLLQACLSLGFNLPYFCWHPAMHSVGACRQCAVKQFRSAEDTKGRIVMACMTPAADGTRISIDDPDAKAFRAAVIEWLMANHPHDCPVCDEGGECHLQDMTVVTGHNYRRHRFAKRTYRNQYLGPFISHVMNRCVQCYRCVRYYRDYAGGRDLDVFASHDHVYFGRYEDGVLESEFSGNLVEICPTGVFTDRTLAQHYTRKWDLQTAPSVCVHCGLGCNTIPGERYGQLRRILNRYHSEVNGYFLCDRGRFGYEFVNSGSRIRQPLVRSGKAGLATPAGKTVALERVTSIIRGGARMIGIGSPRASLEANYALRRLVGPERFYQGMSQADRRLVDLVIEILRRGPARSASLREARASDAVLVLGEDVTNYAPGLALALRQSIRQVPLRLARQTGVAEWNDSMARIAAGNLQGPLILATPSPTKLEEVASSITHAAPPDLARLGQAVAHFISPTAPSVDGLEKETARLARSIASVLTEAERPLVVAGTGCGSEAVLQAAANVAWALCEQGKPAALALTVPEANSLGLGLLGGGSLEEALETVQRGEADTVVVLENDLYRRASSALVGELIERCQHVITMDSLENATTRVAEVVLPAATFAEADGTMVSSEGRAQRLYQVFVPEGEVQESWLWVRDVMAAAGLADALEWQTFDDLVASVARDFPRLRAIQHVAPPGTFREVGQKVPRQPHRWSGRTATTANITVHEPAPTPDPDSPLAFSMEGYPDQPPAPLIARYWAPGWNSVQALNKFQSEVGGPLRGGDPGRRLLEPESTQAAHFGDVPPAFQAEQDRWLVVPAHHIFGSEELSVLTPGIAQLAPQPYLGLNAEEAASRELKEGSEISLSIAGVGYRLPIRLFPSLPAGLALLPVGLPGVPRVILPAWGTALQGGRE